MRLLAYEKEIESTKTSAIDYILVLLMVLMSANPFIKQKNIPFLVVLFFLLIIKNRTCIRNLLVSKFDFFLIFFFFAIECLHAIIFNDLRLLNIFRITFLGYIACLIIKSTNYKFIDIYINIIFYLAIISLIFYSLVYNSAFYYNIIQFADALFPIKTDYNDYHTPTLIFITFDPGYLISGNVYRNPGFAWEAGAFSIFLNIALWFNLFLKRNQKVFSKVNLILIFTIITTFSTTGYIVMFFIIMIFYLNNSTKRIYQIIYLMLFLGISFSVFKNQEFLSKKISKQIEDAPYSTNRFGAVIFDIDDWLERPIFGWSRNIEIIQNKRNYLIHELHRPNGLANTLRSYGIIYFMLYLFVLYNSSEKLCKNFNIKKYKLIGFSFFMVIIFSAFSQLIFDFIFFKGLLFAGKYIYDKQIENVKEFV